MIRTLGPAIFLSFFLVFTLISAAVPIPLFPGNMIPSLVGIPSSAVTNYLGAIANGVAYGFIIWLAFNLGNRRFKKENLKKTR